MVIQDQYLPEIVKLKFGIEEVFSVSQNKFNGSDVFQQANERKYKALRDLSVAVDDSRLLGIKDNKIAQILGKEVGGVADWRDVMNHVFVPYKPPPSVYAGAYEASKTKVRNILPLREMTEEIGATAGQRFPAAPPPEPRPAPLLDRIGETVRETTQSMPSLFDRASRVLREEG